MLQTESETRDNRKVNIKVYRFIVFATEGNPLLSVYDCDSDTPLSYGCGDNHIYQYLRYDLLLRDASEQSSGQLLE